MNRTNTIYLVTPPFERHVLEGFATDVEGIKQIMRNHYHTHFAYPNIDVSIDMEALTVTASAQHYVKMYHIRVIKRAVCSTA
jgi:hypothetical protein